MSHTQHPPKSIAEPKESEHFKRHTISILVENKFGAFNRIAGMFAAKGYNIDSLSVGPTEEEEVSRMTIVTRGDDQIIEQITKQLNKLIDTLKVVDLTFESFVDRELVLVKVYNENLLNIQGKNRRYQSAIGYA
jgi:acetolactate synthase-1/3 small subunit